MGKTLKHIVSTRHLSLENHHKAEAANIEINDVELLEISHCFPLDLSEALLDSSATFVFTSTHAVLAVVEFLVKNPQIHCTQSCYTIDGRTRLVAQKNGFNVVGSRAYGKELAHLLLADEITHTIHFTTPKNRKELRTILTQNGCAYREVFVYEKSLNPIVITSPMDGVLFFSPSQIDCFLSVNALSDAIPAFCIGTTTQQHILNLNHKNTIVAAQPSESALLDAVLHYFTN